jgi:hypothetical protein
MGIYFILTKLTKIKEIFRLGYLTSILAFRVLDLGRGRGVIKES